ncbi:MAG: zinc ribbon domain-containing protein [Lentisphaeria bacterium]|nr:zinc ribbon domain-containing protein [Lentisphaeria bacterium]
MPIYEYLCVPCNRVFSFMVKNHAQAQEKQPTCPRCGGKDMTRVMSSFAISGQTRKSARGDDGGGGDDPMDDPRVEREMMKLMAAAESMDENDPRQLGALMRKMSEVSGECLDPEMEEAVRRLEAGEDPDKIEEDMGDLLDDDPGGMGGAMGGGPSYDDGMYSL